MLPEWVRKGGIMADYGELYVVPGACHAFKCHPPSESQKKIG